MPKQVSHFYDGWWYRIIVDRIFFGFYPVVSEQISEGSSVLDIGCGTGALAFYLATASGGVSRKAGKIFGVDLSKAMIDYAISRNKFSNVNFQCADASHLDWISDREFDVAIISMAMHEMPHETRLAVLAEAKRVAKKIIVIDYAVPVPRGWRAKYFWLGEKMAGGSHYRGYQDFLARGGVEKVLQDVGFNVLQSVPVFSGVLRVVAVD